MRIIQNPLSYSFHFFHIHRSLLWTNSSPPPPQDAAFCSSSLLCITFPPDVHLHCARAAGRGDLLSLSAHPRSTPITTAHAVCDQFFKGGWTLWPHELIWIVFSTPIKSIPARIMTCFLHVISPQAFPHCHTEESCKHLVYLWLVPQSKYLFL